MVLESRKRREHLSEDDLQKNKAILETLTRGHSQTINENGEQVSCRCRMGKRLCFVDIRAFTPCEEDNLLSFAI